MHVNFEWILYFLLEEFMSIHQNCMHRMVTLSFFYILMKREWWKCRDVHLVEMSGYTRLTHSIFFLNGNFNYLLFFKSFWFRKENFSYLNDIDIEMSRREIRAPSLVLVEKEWNHGSIGRNMRGRKKNIYRYIYIYNLSLCIY